MVLKCYFFKVLLTLYEIQTDRKCQKDRGRRMGVERERKEECREYERKTLWLLIHLQQSMLDEIKARSQELNLIDPCA